MRLRRPGPDPDTSALRERIAELKSSQWLQDRRLEDVHALAVLQPLLLGHPVLPLTGSALRPHCLTHIINDILINRRRRILEFGTGLSTILLARLFRHNGLDAHILSVDHDEHWVRAAGQLRGLGSGGTIYRTAR